MESDKPELTPTYLVKSAKSEAPQFAHTGAGESGPLGVLEALLREFASDQSQYEHAKTVRGETLGTQPSSLVE